MDAGDLAVFAAVARAGGITKAAQTLNTVQSNVTQRIRLLEAELGVPLFHRHSRGVTLTSAGAQLLPYAERIGRLIGEAKLAAANGPVPRGRIAIGALETATAVRLPPILAAYAASFPEVDIEIATGTSAELMDAVLAHRLEAAFVAGPVDHPQLVAHPLLEEELVVVTAPWVAGLDGLAAPGASGKVKIVVFRAGCTYRVRLEALLAARGVVGVRRLEFGTLDGIIGCVGAGVGVTLLPRAVVARAGAEGRVALHALPPDEARVETVLVRRRDAFVSTALMRFIEMAREHLAAGDTGRRTAARARLIAPRPAGRPAKATATPNPRAMAMAGTPRLKRSVQLPARPRREDHADRNSGHRGGRTGDVEEPLRVDGTWSRSTPDSRGVGGMPGGGRPPTFHPAGGRPGALHPGRMQQPDAEQQRLVPQHAIPQRRINAS